MPIPSKINLIWFGGMPSDKYIYNLLKWRELNPSMEVVLWSSKHSLSNQLHPELEDEVFNKLSALCKENDISFKDIDAEELPNAINIKFEIDHQNWARASDIARLGILYAHGGYYFDTDLVPETALDTDLGKRADLLQFIAEDDPDKRLNIYFMASAPGHPLYKSTLDLITMRYDNVRRTDFRGFFTTKDEQLLGFVTSFLTGSSLQTLFDRSGYDKSAVRFPLKKFVRIFTDHSWLQGATSQIDRDARSEFIRYIELDKTLEESQIFRDLVEKASTPCQRLPRGVFFTESSRNKDTDVSDSVSSDESERHRQLNLNFKN